MQTVISNLRSTISSYLNTSAEAAPLAAFRLFFGLLMLISIIRFWAYGWIDKLYIQPKFHFSYYGFEWVQPLGQYTYLLFIVCGLSAIAIAIGYQYRFAIITFFLSFTYIELMDKTTYLNHYYFISILSFLMIWLPAGRYFSVDAYRNAEVRSQRIPRWTIDSIKLLLCIVYFYAGLAKLNSDWLIEAMPLKIWLPGRYDLPLLGNLMEQEWAIYALSWAGALYDLAIPFLLLNRSTRLLGFALVVVFHLLTSALFPIGMFPYIMIVSALIFFSPALHHQILNIVARLGRFSKRIFDNNQVWVPTKSAQTKLKLGVVGLFFVLQIVLPFRYMLYPGELFWTEEGFRFSWRVMLMEKAGYTNFKIVDQVNKKTFYVDNSDFLSTFQEKQMAFQPDFILEYAHFLKDHFTAQGHQHVAVYAESYVALNGRRSKPFIDPNVDLAAQPISLQPKPWILPFHDQITGL